MIQRIQSLYLFLSALVLGALFAPYGDFFYSEVAEQSSYFQDAELNLNDSPVLWGIATLSIVLFFVSIFLFNNRKIQGTLVRVGMLSVLALIIVAGVLMYMDIQGSITNFGLGIAFCVFAIIFGILASRNIRKDEDLVRSMDRLR